MNDLSAYLDDVLSICTPRVRDAVARGRINSRAVRRAIHRAAACHGIPSPAAPPRAAMLEASLWWAMAETDSRGAQVMVLARHESYPAAPVVSVRRNQSHPDAYVVDVRCPYAALHLHRYRGHAIHSHGWRGSDPDVNGGIGVRVPHCEGATVGRERLTNYELILLDDPAAARERAR